MNFPAQGLKHPLKTILGMIALAILVAGLVSSASIGKAQAGKMGGGAKAAPATMAAKTGPSRFNHVADSVRPSQKPSVAKERVPCRRPHCNPWHDHTH
jgi:hypothetical protein